MPIFLGVFHSASFCGIPAGSGEFMGCRGDVKVTRIACLLQISSWQRSTHAGRPIGSTRYTAIVRMRKGKTIVHQEYKTFAHRVRRSELGETPRG